MSYHNMVASSISQIDAVNNMEQENGHNNDETETSELYHEQLATTIEEEEKEVEANSEHNNNNKVRDDHRHNNVDKKATQFRKNRTYRMEYPVQFDRMIISGIPAAIMKKRWDPTQYNTSSLSRNNNRNNTNNDECKTSESEQLLQVNDDKHSSVKINKIISKPVYICTAIEQIDLMKLPNTKCILLSIIVTILWYLLILLILALTAWATYVIVIVVKAKHDNATNTTNTTDESPEFGIP